MTPPAIKETLMQTAETVTNPSPPPIPQPTHGSPYYKHREHSLDLGGGIKSSTIADELVDWILHKLLD